MNQLSSAKTVISSGSFVVETDKQQLSSYIGFLQACEVDIPPEKIDDVSRAIVRLIKGFDSLQAVYLFAHVRDVLRTIPLHQLQVDLGVSEETAHSIAEACSSFVEVLGEENCRKISKSIRRDYLPKAQKRDELLVQLLREAGQEEIKVNQHIREILATIGSAVSILLYTSSPREAWEIIAEKVLGGTSVVIDFENSHFFDPFRSPLDGGKLSQVYAKWIKTQLSSSEQEIEAIIVRSKDEELLLKSHIDEVHHHKIILVDPGHFSSD